MSETLWKTPRSSILRGGPMRSRRSREAGAGVEGVRVPGCCSAASDGWDVGITAQRSPAERKREPPGYVSGKVRLSDAYGVS